MSPAAHETTFADQLQILVHVRRNRQGRVGRERPQADVEPARRRDDQWLDRHGFSGGSARLPPQRAAGNDRPGRTRGAAANHERWDRGALSSGRLDACPWCHRPEDHSVGGASREFSPVKPETTPNHIGMATFRPPAGCPATGGRVPEQEQRTEAASPNESLRLT